LTAEGSCGVWRYAIAPVDWKAALPVQLTERRSAIAAIVAWLWVSVMALAYLAQFTDYIRPILALFG